MSAEELLTPAKDGTSRIEDYMRRLPDIGGPSVDSYANLWQWSVDDLDSFWQSIWRYFDVPGEGDVSPALVDSHMPGARWFPKAALNYAEVLLRMPGRGDDDAVVIARSQTREDVVLTAAQFRDQVGRARAGLLRLGVRRGDRVAAYVPNIPEAAILMAATASIGAVFTSCAAEFGTLSVVDRWKQIEPTVVLAVDGYMYGTKPVSRHDEVKAIVDALPGDPTLVWLPYLDSAAEVPNGAVRWSELLAEPGPIEFDQVPFDTPLVILFSSGTTGLPKPIVHGHGGIALEHLKALALQNDLGPEDRYFYYSTTSWVMWNILVSGLAVGATIVLFDGNPAFPDGAELWRMAGELELTYFGTSAPFLLQCRRDGIEPRQLADLSRLRAIGSTGAPLPPEGYRWVSEHVGESVRLTDSSGGTDVATGFVGGVPVLPVRAGTIPCRLLGCAVEAFDPTGRSVIGEVGELVVTKPMPSMPVGFWGDDDGKRYRAAYFEEYPGIWRHGDWIQINSDGSCVITGRSDATLNRGGVRLGTSEFYSVVEDLPGVVDSLVVHIEDAEGGTGHLILFVSTDGRAVDDILIREIGTALRTRLSPRHVPDEVIGVQALPRTLTGKRLEVPIKKILRGAHVDDVVAKGAVSHPETLAAFAKLSHRKELS